LDKAISTLKPYKELWELVDKFESNHNIWTKELKFTELEPEVIEKENKGMYQ